MIWTIILAVISWILFRFYSDYKKQEKEIKTKGGMLDLYNEIINFILTSDPNAKIIEEKSNSITIEINSKSSSTHFYIAQVFSIIYVEYRLRSYLFGNHKLKWEFPIGTNQSTIINKVKFDIINFNKNLI